MTKWVCSVCGYEYDPAENGNVAFEDLPDDTYIFLEKQLKLKGVAHLFSLGDKVNSEN